MIATIDPMTKTTDAMQLASHLMEFLEEVKAGDEVVVTSGEKAVARLVPISEPSKRRQRSVQSLHPLSGRWTG